MRGSTVGLGAAIGLLQGAAIWAQAPSPVLSERIDVRLVEVELWATKDDRPVLDLLQSELRLFSDGEPVDIGFFTPPDPASGREDGNSSSSGAWGATEDSSGGVPRTVAVFLDEAHLTPAHRARVVGELVEWLEQRFDDRSAVTLVRYGNSLELVAPRHAAREVVVRTLRELAKPSARAVGEEIEERQTLDAIRDQQRRGLDAIGWTSVHGERGPRLGRAEPANFFSEIPCSRRMLAMAEDLSIQAERTARDSIAALGAYASALAAAPGRKLLLFASDGIPLRPGGAAYDLVRTLCDGSGATQGIEDAIDVSSLPDRIRSRADLLDRQTLALAGESLQLANPLAAVAAQANADGITIWTLGARGLTTVGVEASVRSRDRTGADELRQRVDLEAALSSLAADTGGRALLDLGDFGDGLDELASELGSSYLLAFLAPRVADGKLHPIRVETTRRGVRLRYRGIWRDTSGEVELGELMTAALLYGIDHPGLRASARSVRNLGDSGETRTVLRVVLAGDSISLLPTEDGGLRGALRIAIAVREPGGEPSPVRSRAFPVEQPPTSTGSPTVPLVYDIALPPLAVGATVVVGLRDEVGGDVGVLRILVEEP